LLSGVVVGDAFDALFDERGVEIDQEAKCLF
jgi:hypothetical protein